MRIIVLLSGFSIFLNDQYHRFIVLRQVFDQKLLCFRQKEVVRMAFSYLFFVR
jgi:hypothetical protein